MLTVISGQGVSKIHVSWLHIFTFAGTFQKLLRQYLIVILVRRILSRDIALQQTLRQDSAVGPVLSALSQCCGGALRRSSWSLGH